MQTIAETEAENNNLAASLFFSRLNNRDDPQKVFPTIAFQLATKLSPYRQYLAQQMETDPSFLDKTIENQFKDLFVIPFNEKQLLGTHRGRVILLDGLDECKGTREQRRIIKLISNFVTDHPIVPLRWIIASRPEQHLVDDFFEIETLLQTSFWEKELPINSDASVRDVELYLRNEFTRIQHHYHNLMVTYERWPSEKQFLVVSRAASGLFIFASTVIRFIDDDEDPVDRLNLVLSVLEKQLNQRILRVNPLALLDALYKRILSDLSFDALSRAKLVLGYLIIRDHIKQDKLPPQPFWNCNILGFEQHTLYGTLRKLRSVLYLPEPEDAWDNDVRFLHASFPDFLQDQTRSDEYSVNLNEIATYLWRRCMTILPQWADPSADCVEYTWNVESLRKVMRKKESGSDVTGFKLYGFSTCWWILLQMHFTATTFHLLLSTEELMKQLRELDFSRESILPVDHEIHSFIEDLETHMCPNHRDFIYRIPLGLLNEEGFLRSLYERWWIVRNGSFEHLGPKSKEILEKRLVEFKRLVRTKSRGAREIIDAMNGRNLLALLPVDVTVTVIGAPSKRRVWLERTRPSLSIFFPYIA